MTTWLLIFALAVVALRWWSERPRRPVARPVPMVRPAIVVRGDRRFEVHEGGHVEEPVTREQWVPFKSGRKGGA